MEFLYPPLDVYGWTEVLREERLEIIRILYQTLSCFRHDTQTDARQRAATERIMKLIRREVDAFKIAEEKDK